MKPIIKRIGFYSVFIAIGIVPIVIGMLYELIKNCFINGMNLMDTLIEWVD